MVCTDSSSTSFCQDKKNNNYIQCQVCTCGLNPLPLWWYRNILSIFITHLQPAHYTETGMIREDKSKKIKILPLFSPFVRRRVQYKSHLCTREICIAICTETQCPSQHLSYQQCVLLK